MTRDEAVELFHKISYPVQTGLGAANYAADRRWSERAIDGFVALGMLTLDEPPKPKCARERAVDAMFQLAANGGDGLGGLITPRHAIDAIERAGLQIVER